MWKTSSRYGSGTWFVTRLSHHLERPATARKTHNAQIRSSRSLFVVALAGSLRRKKSGTHVTGLKSDMMTSASTTCCASSVPITYELQTSFFHVELNEW
jgi:hypothetical protein